MKITFSDKAPKGFLGVRFVDEPRSVKRLVREKEGEVLEIGIGKKEEVNLRKFVVLCRAVINAAKVHKATKIALSSNDLSFPSLVGFSKEEIASLVAQNMVMAGYAFRRYKSTPKEGWREVDTVCIYGTVSPLERKAFLRGVEIGEGVNIARELSNTPGGDMTPRTLALSAKNVAKGTSITVETLGLAQIKKLGMGALLGVAKGSDEPPTFTVMQYKGGAGKPIVLVGKGITFDTGGINIKSEHGIGDMHMDMSGGAAVIATLSTVARLRLKKHVIGIIPAAENMPSGGALRPHDVLHSLSGKTIEVGNTDAEGRLILADALTYAKRFKPGVVIDVATLTGAVMSALGLHASGVFTKDDALAEKLIALGEQTGDYLWRLPLWDEFEEGLKSDIADMNNVPGSGPGSRYGGASNGAIFLWQFAKELGCPWAHLDIASRMTSIPSDELSKGALGTPVRLLVQFVEEWTA